MNMTLPSKRPVRFFNTTGPCFPWDHYMLPPADRLIGARLDRYISDSLYWVLHAPRQTGKTTFLLDWMRKLNSGGDIAALYISLEACQTLVEPEHCMPTICEIIKQRAKMYDLPIPEVKTTAPGGMLTEILQNFSSIVAHKQLVLLFDEVDALEGEAMVSFLRQLRSNFPDRGVGKFPVSIVLVGMRDLRDYITAAKDGVSPNPFSPFNIKTDSILLSNFSRDDVQKLFAQRTEETGQRITDEAFQYVWEQSMGQPWIVNSLFERATTRILEQDDYSAVTLEHVESAREQMTLARETHLDSLATRLREAKIKKIIEPIIIGEINPELGRENLDVQYVMDMGLIKWDTQNGLTIANPIYSEIITRNLNSGYHDIMPPPSAWKWQKADGSLDMDSLLREFQRFWRRHSEIWDQKADYTEAFPHLLLMAFLQRILNGGGKMEREAAAGRGRMDLLVEYKGVKAIIEIKLIRSYDTPGEVRDEGLQQIALYRDKTAPTAPAYLMIFDRRETTRALPWDERISWTQDSGITVLGC
jgi:hypothetical protein